MKVYPSWKGKSFKKMTVARTNDPDLPKFFLTLKGWVDDGTGKIPDKPKQEGTP